MQPDQYMTKVGMESVDWVQLSALYREVGLVAGLGKKGDLPGIRRAFEASTKVVTVWLGDRLAGAGRLISDGVCYGAIFDVGVVPEFQGQGVGKRVMSELLFGNEHLCIHLTSTFGNEPFYRKLGFKRHKTAMALYPFESNYLEE